MLGLHDIGKKLTLRYFFPLRYEKIQELKKRQFFLSANHPFLNFNAIQLVFFLTILNRMKDFSHGRLDLKLSEQQAELARLSCFDLIKNDCDWWFAVHAELSFCSKQQNNCNMTCLSSFAYLISQVLKKRRKERCQYHACA